MNRNSFFVQEISLKSVFLFSLLDIPIGLISLIIFYGFKGEIHGQWILLPLGLIIHQLLLVCVAVIFIVLLWAMKKFVVPLKYYIFVYWFLSLYLVKVYPMTNHYDYGEAISLVWSHFIAVYLLFAIKKIRKNIF